VMFNNGGGRNKYAAPLTIDVTQPGPLVAADFDGNGTVDLAVTSDSFGVQLLSATHDRKLQTGQKIAHARATLAGYFTGDGKLDFAGDGEDAFSVVAGNRDGTFASPVSYGPVAG